MRVVATTLPLSAAVPNDTTNVERPETSQRSLEVLRLKQGSGLMKLVSSIVGVMFCAVVQVTPASRPDDDSPRICRLCGCHVSPQGGGLLTSYGRGVDVAQSARAREFLRPMRTPADISTTSALLS